MANINETLIPIPGRLHSVATEGHVAGADEIYDDTLGKDQETINGEVQTALGTGGTVDQKIESAVNALDATASQTGASANGYLNLSVTETNGKVTAISGSIDDAAYIDDTESSPAVVPGFDPTTDTVHVTAQTLSEQQKAQVRTNIGLGDVDAKINEAVASEASQRAAGDSSLQSNINNVTSNVNSRLNTQDQKIALLNGAEVIVVEDHTAVSSPDPQKIYREIGTSSYTDWMNQTGNANDWKAIATYTPGIEDVPTADSNNLVKSGGVNKVHINLLKDTKMVNGSYNKKTAIHPSTVHTSKFLDSEGKLHNISSDLYSVEEYDITPSVVYSFTPNRAGTTTNYGYAFYNGTELVTGGIEGEQEIIIKAPIGTNKLYINKFNNISTYCCIIEQSVVNEIESGKLYYKEFTSATDIFDLYGHWKSEADIYYTIFSKNANTYTAGLNIYYEDGTQDYLDTTIEKRENVYNFHLTKDCYRVRLLMYGTFPGNALLNWRVFDSKEKYESFIAQSKKDSLFVSSAGLDKMNKEDVAFERKISFFIDEYAKVRELSDNPAYEVGIIQCSYLDVFYLNVNLLYDSNYSFVFYEDDNFLYPICGERGNVDKVVMAPQGSKYLVFQYRDTYYNTVRKVTINSPLFDKLWCCIGDSLTEVNSSATKRYFDYINSVTGINIQNLGLSGTGYAKSYDSYGSFKDRISQISADANIITIFGSFNDIYDGLDMGSITDVAGANTICGQIKYTIEQIVANNPLKPLGIITPTPWEGITPNDESAIATKAKDYVDNIVMISKMYSVPCLDLYHCSNLYPNSAEFRQLCYSHDDGNGVHPDENGHKIIAPKIEQFIKSLI